jgi:hypothetical protein
MQKQSITNNTTHSNGQNPVERAEFDLRGEAGLLPIHKFFSGLLKIIQAKNDDSKKSGGSHRAHFVITIGVIEKWHPIKKQNR